MHQAGYNQTQVLNEETDIDGEERVQGGVIDIGADETDACATCVLSLEALARYVPFGNSATVRAMVTGPSGGIIDQNVDFSVVRGSATLNPTSAPTVAPNGTADSTVSATTPGWVTIKATTIDPCNRLVSDTVDICFYNGTVIDLFLCIDCTGSMGDISGPNHRAGPSIEAFLRDISYAIPAPIRVGGVKFNEGGPDSIDMSKLRSLSAFTTMDAFITDWLYNAYSPGGGDPPEMQLDALHYAAEDLGNNGTAPLKYVLLVTDNDYHENYPPLYLTKAGMVGPPAFTDAPVYISLWDQSYEFRYAGLNVNGEFDPPNPLGTDVNGNYKYPLAKLRARILADQ